MVVRNGRIRKAVNWALPKVAAMARRYIAYKTGLPDLSRYKKRGRATGYGVTTQHDRSVQYVKKTMPKGRKRKWRKFVKRVRAVELKDRGLQTVLMNNSFNFISASGKQTFGECHLYSAQGTKNRGCRDILIGLANSAKGQPDYDVIKDTIVPGMGLTADSTTHTSHYYGHRPSILMQSAVLDITLTNTAETGVELDLYHVVYRGVVRNSPQGAQYLGNLGEILAQGLSHTTQAVYCSMGTDDLTVEPYTYQAKPELETRGMTLFECGAGISRSGAKILKKTKYFIAPGNSITYQIRDPKNRSISLDRLASMAFMWPGLTQTVCFIAKSLDTSGIASIQAKWTRTYKYTVEGEKTSTIAHFSGE